MSSWYSIDNADEIASPALLVYRQRVVENIRLLVGSVGDVGRLRPHVKTHKSVEVTQLCIAAGIRKFKCATIAEVEMVAGCATAECPLEVLLAYPTVGPTARRLLTVATRFPNARVQATADNPLQLGVLAENARQSGLTVEVLVDLDVGMHRTGIAPDERAIALYELITQQANLTPGGLHVYDGHIHDSDPAARANRVEAAYEAVKRLRGELSSRGWPVPRVVAGGSFSLPTHVIRGDCEVSPGTPVFWDQGYATQMPESPFLPAAMLLTRVVSCPAPNHLCLDLGYKAVSTDQGANRYTILELPNARHIAHSEEHLVVACPEARRFQVGDALYAVPWHVCPTVALYDEAHVVENNRVIDRWEIIARRRRLSI